MNEGNHGEKKFSLEARVLSMAMDKLLAVALRKHFYLNCSVRKESASAAPDNQADIARYPVVCYQPQALYLSWRRHNIP